MHMEFHSITKSRGHLGRDVWRSGAVQREQPVDFSAAVEDAHEAQLISAAELQDFFKVILLSFWLIFEVGGGGGSFEIGGGCFGDGRCALWGTDYYFYCIMGH